jgi:sugar lactone lactonase YvrE
VCVQSVFADGDGSLWVLDPAAPAMGPVVPDGPKLVRVDLARNEVVQKIGFGPDVAPHGSYLNDVRIAPGGAHAFLTDSGARGALVVVDLGSGGARRVLDGHPATQWEKGVVVKADGRELRRTDGRGMKVAADGIALATDGRHLYWQALTGRTLYRAPTAALANPDLGADELAAQVERVGDNGLSDGLWFDDGRLYISAFDMDAIKVRENGQVRVLLRDERLRWPDTFAAGPDGWIYVTASRIQDMAWFQPENGPRLRTSLFRFRPPWRGAAGAASPR